MEEREAQSRYEATGVGPPWSELPINTRRLLAIAFEKNDATLRRPTEYETVLVQHRVYPAWEIRPKPWVTKEH